MFISCTDYYGVLGYSDNICKKQKQKQNKIPIRPALKQKIKVKIMW